MDISEPITEDQEMNEFTNDMGDGFDMMNMMHQTQQEMSTTEVIPPLLVQGTTHVTAVNNEFTGKPLNLDGSFKPQPSIKDVASINIAPVVVENEITINIGAADTAEPYMDDDLDNYDAKDDLTKDQQKQDGNVNLARYVASKMDHLADDVMNVDELEQQYRMTKDPDNPKNIFVLKFGKNEEQHWKLPWNPTTNLLCHMEPNKLLIEQSKYNAMYMKYSMTPREYKKAMMKRQKQRIQKVRIKEKKQKMKEVSRNMKPCKPTMIDTASGGVMAVPTMNNNLLAVNGINPIQRGTFMANPSMLVHSQQTVTTAPPTDQQQLISNTLTAPALKEHEHVLTPITAQIRPELIKMIKPRSQRRVSLASGDGDDDWGDSNSNASNNTNSTNESDAELDRVPKKKLSKLSHFQVQVSVGEDDKDGMVQRLNSKNEIVNEFNPDYGLQTQQIQETPAERRGKFNVIKPTIMDGMELQWKPPKISLEMWNAVDVWQGILYLGDEWDALNYVEIMDNSVEYFINCSAGYCAFDYEKKVQQFWLENWRTNREKEHEKQKLKNSIERERRRKIRLKKFQRAHPEWKPVHKTKLRDTQSNITESSEIQKQVSSNMDLNKASIVDFALFVQHQSPSSTHVNPDDLGQYLNKEIRFREAKDEDIQQELEYFKENRKEFDIIQSLHNDILDLEIDDSDHSSMYDSCISSDEYQYDSDEYDEYLTMTDGEIIDKLCPFKFLNIYAHNWEGYRLLDLHMNDVWNFIEQCRMKNMNLKTQWKNMNMKDKPPKVSCLVFCTKNTIPMSRLNMEIAGDVGYTLDQVGRSVCNIIKTYESQQIEIEDNVWNEQSQLYTMYIDAVHEMQQEKARLNAAKKDGKQVKQKIVIRKPMVIKHELITKRKNDIWQRDGAKMFNYKYWELDDKTFWDDFESLKTRDEPLNRLFASSFDRSGTLVLGFMIHSGIRLKQALKALQRNKPNTLRNQSFLRQLIQLDWMKHMFAKPGMREQVPFRDEYECYELDQYLLHKRHYNLK